MSTLILYATKHGCTERCAHKIGEHLPGGAEIRPLKQVNPAILDKYDTVVLGGSIHAGRVQGAVKKFAARHSAALREKKLGLFICCMEEGEKAQQQLESSFPPDLLKHAVVSSWLGGAFTFERMNPLERAIIKKISGTDRNVEKIDEQKIAAFARRIT
ncbi:flavodoxin [bacterium]|nr:flavodoxin [bacterium]